MRIKRISESISQEVNIRLMVESDVDKLLDLKYQYFGKFYKDKKAHDIYAKSLLDLDVSLVAEIDGKIVGGYMLRVTNLPNYIGNFYDFTGDIMGVEGISIFVSPEVKSKGVGRMLMDYYKTNDIGIDFIWGKAFHGLNNLDIWLKRRELFNDIYGVYYTIEFYNNRSINQYKSTKYLEYYNKYNESIVDLVDEELELYDIKINNNIDTLTKSIVDQIFNDFDTDYFDILNQSVKHYLEDNIY